MKVKKLIEILKTLNQELDIEVQNNAGDLDEICYIVESTFQRHKYAIVDRPEESMNEVVVWPKNEIAYKVAKGLPIQPYVNGLDPFDHA